LCFQRFFYNFLAFNTYALKTEQTYQKLLRIQDKDIA